MKRYLLFSGQDYYPSGGWGDMAGSLNTIGPRLRYRRLEVDMETGLMPCPCGQTPKGLSIEDVGQGGKYALVSGHCCGEWSIEFRTGYHDLNSDECMNLAIEAWNEAKRSSALADEFSTQNIQ